MVRGTVNLPINVEYIFLSSSNDRVLVVVLLPVRPEPQDKQSKARPRHQCFCFPASIHRCNDRNCGCRLHFLFIAPPDVHTSRWSGRASTSNLATESSCSCELRATNLAEAYSRLASGRDIYNKAKNSDLGSPGGTRGGSSELTVPWTFLSAVEKPTALDTGFVGGRVEEHERGEGSTLQAVLTT